MTTRADLPVILDTLARLVAFDTESDRSNLPLIHDVAARLAAHGIASEVLPNGTGDKAALLATIGPHAEGGVVLSGHTDVVPVAGQAWSSDPYKLRVEGGRAYGRGAVDMKGFVALCLALAPEMAAARLTRPVHLLFSYDEETTCLGSLDGIARLIATGRRPGAAIVGEPTDWEVADAHKGVTTFDTLVTGREAHSSKPALGASAVTGGVMLAAELDRLRREMIARGDPTGRFDPPYVTVHIGQIIGGTARNILPLRCRLVWEYRGIPGAGAESVPVDLDAYARAHVLPLLRATAPEADIVTTLGADVPGLAPEPGSPAEALAFRVAGRNGTICVPFATEAGHFQAAGIPTVVCGPGNVDKAHQPDEFIEVAQLEAGAGVLRRLIGELSG